MWQTSILHKVQLIAKRLWLEMLFTRAARKIRLIEAKITDLPVCEAY